MNNVKKIDETGDLISYNFEKHFLDDQSLDILSRVKNLFFENNIWLVGSTALRTFCNSSAIDIPFAVAGDIDLIISNGDEEYTKKCIRDEFKELVRENAMGGLKIIKQEDISKQEEWEKELYDPKSRYNSNPQDLYREYNYERFLYSTGDKSLLVVNKFDIWEEQIEDYINNCPFSFQRIGINLGTKEIRLGPGFTEFLQHKTIYSPLSGPPGNYDVQVLIYKIKSYFDRGKSGGVNLSTNLLNWMMTHDSVDINSNWYISRFGQNVKSLVFNDLSSIENSPKDESMKLVF